MLEIIQKAFDDGKIDALTFMKACVQYDLLKGEHQMHKYIERVPDGKGGFRYIYKINGPKVGHDNKNNVISSGEGNKAPANMEESELRRLQNREYERIKNKIKVIPGDRLHAYDGGTKPNFAGSFATVLAGHGHDYTMFSLDDSDRQWIKDVKLKEDEQLYRIQTDEHRRLPMLGSPMVKVNKQKGLVYFLSEEGKEKDEPIFEAKGIKMHYLSLAPKEFNEFG